MQYTPDQEQAIRHRNGNLLILACAGSGKTEVVSRRIAELVSEGTPKGAVAAFTFTDRAAAELKARIRSHLESMLPNDPALGDMYVGTIHSFALQLLKELDPSYRKYEVMDEARQAALIMTNFNRIGLTRMRPLTRTGGYWDTVKTFITTLNVVHQKGIRLKSISDPELVAAIESYSALAYGAPNYFFDFDRIIVELIRYLKKNLAVLKEVRDRFDYLVVDEYQDVDDRQEQLIRLLSHRGRAVWITAVGDDDQAIYGWRGARIDNILSFHTRYPDVTRIRLKDNFRSTHAIVDIANSAISHIPSDRRLPKAMEATHWDEPSETFMETLADFGDVQLRTFDTDSDEAAWVADQIEELRGTIIAEKDGTTRAIDYADMAILLRSVRSSGRIFSTALHQRGIPVIVKGIGGLFEHEEVQLVYGAFCLLARADMMLRQDDAYVRYDERGIRQIVRNRIRELRDIHESMPHADEASFLAWIAAKREDLDRRNLERERRGRLARRIYPQAIFQEMLAALGSAVGPEPWPQQVLFNLGRLSNLITEFEAVHQWLTPRDLPSLCIFLGGWAAGQVDEGGLEESVGPNAVQIMTVHAAKGLEWPVVFVPRVSSSNFPSSLRNRGPATFIDPAMFDPKDYAGGDDGERRLWYVVLTRCRRFLSISSVSRPRKHPTYFFTEIHHDTAQRSDPRPFREKGVPTPPADVELLPTTYTDLSTFWRCGFEYQLRALMGFGPGVKESYGYGQQIHNVLAEVHKNAREGNYLNVDEVLQLVDERFHLRYTRDGDQFKPLSMLRNAAKASLERYLVQYSDNARFVLEAEKPFELVDRDTGALITGTVDLLERIDTQPNGETIKAPVAVVDFKTYRWRDLEGFLRRKAEVEDQLRLYALAVGQTLGFDAAKGVAHFLSPRPPNPQLIQAGVRESVEVDVSAGAQERIRTRVGDSVRSIVQSIKTRNFKLDGVEHQHCPRCDFREVCPGYTQWGRRNRAIPRPSKLEDSGLEELLYIEEDLNAGQTP